jgi:hypothetical protein
MEPFLSQHVWYQILEKNPANYQFHANGTQVLVLPKEREDRMETRCHSLIHSFTHPLIHLSLEIEGSEKGGEEYHGMEWWEWKE